MNIAGSLAVAPLSPRTIELIAAAHHEIKKPNSKLLTGVLAKYAFEVTDPEGRVTARRDGPSRSFLRNFGRFIRQIHLVTVVTNDQVVDIGGVSRTLAVVDTAAVGAGNESPVHPGFPAQYRFGSSGAAVDSSQFDVQAFLTGAQTPAVLLTVNVEDASQLQFSFTAGIQNTSGGTWNVQEQVAFVNLRDGTLAAQNRQIAILRDVFASTPVPNLSTGNGHYTISVPV